MSADQSPQAAARWRTVEAVFHDLADQPPGPARDAHVLARCGDDPSMADEVRALLDSDALAAGSHAAPDPHLGLRLGAYEVDTLIARGGMAAVYRAHRADDTFQQRVAVKIMDLRLSDAGLVERFKAERQLLATLEHPALTRLLDGGVTPIGEPYLVMELVDGHRIDRYCDAQQLSVVARVRLFLQVCAGLSYAHARRVVHRDLKPSNILVTAEGHAKVVDFGTAALLEPGRISTESRAPLTPAYASPEQLTGAAVGPASDQYSLGLVLYELLTGAPAFSDHGSLIASMERAVSGTPPTTLVEAATAAAAQTRATSLPLLRQALAGDLDTIVTTMLAADPAKRHESLQAVADELGRWLDGTPITTRPQSWWPRLPRRAGRWNTPALAVGLAAVGVVALGAVWVSRQSAGTAGQVVAEQRRDEARQLAATVLSDVYREVSNVSGSASARLVIVERARRLLDAQLAEAPDDPALRATMAQAYIQLAETLGQPFAISLGDSAGALATFRKAETLVPNDDSLESLALLVRARQGIAELLIRAGAYDEAARTASTAIEAARRLWEQAPLDFRVLDRPVGVVYVRVHAVLGHALLRAADVTRDIDGVTRALADFEQTIAIAEQVRRRDPSLPDMAGRYSQYVGYSNDLLGDFTGDAAYRERARVAHQRSADASRATWQASPSAQTKRDFADGLVYLGWAESGCGRHDEAIATVTRALALFEEVAAENRDSQEVSLDVASAQFRLGGVLAAAGRLTDAKARLTLAQSMVRLPDPVTPTDRETVVLIARINEHLTDVLLRLNEPEAAVAAAAAAVNAVRDGTSVPPWRLAELEAKLNATRVSGRRRARAR
jgi:non-specific serine/threonine protein kinase/serine/threonine-protein kinase